MEECDQKHWKKCNKTGMSAHALHKVATKSSFKGKNTPNI